jgi:hypothetical protein
MMLVLTKHGRGLPLVDDQDAVEEFAAEAAGEAFGDRVGPRWPDRVRMILTSMALNTASKVAMNIGVAVPNETRKRRPASSRSMQRLRACWVSQALVG